MKQQAIKLLVRFHIIIIWVIILILFGITLLRLQAISNPKPDAKYLEEKGRAYQSDDIRIKASVREQIDKLQETPVNTQPGQLGTSDPFNP